MKKYIKNYDRLKPLADHLGTSVQTLWNMRSSKPERLKILMRYDKERFSPRTRMETKVFKLTLSTKVLEDIIIKQKVVEALR